MDTFLRYALLGLGAGGGYAIAGIGLVQVYRGSGVLNLAHGTTAFAAAVLFARAYTGWGLPFWLAVAVAVATAAAIGALVQLLVMRPLRQAAALVRMIATLGVFAVVQQGVSLLFGAKLQAMTVRSFYPAGKVRLGHGVTVAYDRLILLAVTLVLGVVLWYLTSRTRFGLATTAVAESSVVAASVGVDPDRVATANWIVGSALAGLAGVLLLPIVGVVTAGPFVFLVIPALAAAMIGRFRSFALTIAGGYAVGVGQSLLTRYQGNILPHNLATGWADALPFLVIIVLLVAGGTPFPVRGEVIARLPRIGRGGCGLVGTAVIGGGLAAGTLLAGDRLASAITSTAALAVVGLSLVVIIGLTGQTSLAHLTIAGAGALAAARVSHDLGWPFPLAVLVGVAVGALVGLLFAAPALRTRGPTLAVATIGVGIAIEHVVLANGWLTVGGYSGTPIARPSLAGLDVNGVTHPQRYAAMCVLALVVVAHLVANLRAGPTGRRLIAVRSSERAASALGVGLGRTKTVAFVLSAAIASFGGILLAFRDDSVTYNQFDLMHSLNLVIGTLIGGVGYLLGPVLGAAMAPNGLLAWLVSDLGPVQRWMVITSGVTLILTLILNPDGIAAGIRRRRAPRGTRRRRTPAARPDRAVREPARLEVRNLTVRYGAVTAVAGLSLAVEPGQIVGLIGPNGAGKSSVIDAISGFTQAAGGTIRLGDRDLSRAPAHRRASAGVARSFQTVEPFDDLTVAENLAVARDEIRWYDWVGDLARRRPASLDDELRADAAAFGLSDLDAHPDELSQGGRRLLGVFRALAARPAVLLLDEPAAGLDRMETERLGATLRRVARERQVGLLLVEHDMSLVMEVCDHVVAIDFGYQIFSGSPADAAGDQRIRSAYLGTLDEQEAAYGRVEAVVHS